ncbi:hypothetical protein AAFN88_10035 [Pelagibius sp. CAU 1746]|uniref:hypothetical protein n=1 Tax=Pelagibius sp. CAU 1746 TaxID=3140370 RepID=UPI00325BDEDB
MRRAAWTFHALLIAPVLLLGPLPLAAQTESPSDAPSAVEASEGETAAPAEVLAAFTRLVDRGEARNLFGLPRESFWRRSGALEIAIFAQDAAALRPVLEGVAAPFAEVSGLEISLLETGPAVTPAQDLGVLAPEAELVIIVGSRLDLAEIAAAGGFNKGMLANFEMGRWPFMFVFEKDQRRRGVMLLADDEPARAREAAFILATVWGLGGVTLGPELTGLVRDSDSGPGLTPLGQAVFRLFFHQDLKSGMPLGDAVRRAETLLPQ